VNRSVKVLVAGQRLAVRTGAQPAYVEELARYVTGKIEELRASGGPMTTQSLALLAAMNIADELCQLREQQDRLKRQVRERSERILRYLDGEAEL
jgi:cell division protein ZapA